MTHKPSLDDLDLEPTKAETMNHDPNQGNRPQHNSQPSPPPNPPHNPQWQQPHYQQPPYPAPQPQQPYPSYPPQPQPQQYSPTYPPQQPPTSGPSIGEKINGSGNGTDVASMIRGAVLAGVCLAVCYLLFQRFLVPDGESGPKPIPTPPAVVTDEAAMDAGTFYALTQLRCMAELYDAASKEIENGKIKDIKDLESFIIAGKATLADEATKPLAQELERINGEKWNTGNPKDLTGSVGQGFREIYEAAMRGLK